MWPHVYQNNRGESTFWSSVEDRGLHVEGEGNMSRVQKKTKK